MEELSALNHKLQIASNFEIAEPRSREFPPTRCDMRLKMQIRIGLIKTSIHVPVRIATPISCITSQNIKPSEAVHTVSQIASALRFAIRIIIAITI